MASLGGNSAKATSGLNCVHTAEQSQKGIADSSDLLLQDTIASGHSRSLTYLAEQLAQGALQVHPWLQSSPRNVHLDDVVQLGGHAVARTHRFAADAATGSMPPVGWTLVSKLKAVLETDPRVEVRTETRVVEIMNRPSMDLVHPGPVTGVRVVKSNKEEKEEEEEEFIAASAVVIAAGGFGNDHGPDSLLAKHAPAVAELATTNGPQATGDGVRLGMALGAETVDMDQVQLHPTGFVNRSDAACTTKFLAPEALRGKGGILLNQDGVRFVNELGRRDDVSAAIRAQNKDHSAYIVLSEDAAVAYGMAPIGFYQSKNLLAKAASIDDVAAFIGCPADAVRAAIDKYARDEEDEFGRPSRINAPTVETPSFIVAQITPVVHYTMGGLAINASAEVLYRTPHDNLKPIPGLFAAGEVTGGVHGGNRLGGNSLLECIVFGRIAGKRAAAAVTVPPHVSALQPDKFTALRLSERERVTGNVFRFSFELPSPLQHCGLGVGQYICVRAKINGELIVRPYSPMSRPGDTGRLDLMVKADPDAKGAMTVHMAQLKLGDVLEFAGPMGGVDLYKRRPKKIGLIAGGVGVAPMLSIIRTVFRERTGHEMRLMYGAVTEDDMPFKDLLLAKAKERSDFDVLLTLDKPPEAWEHRAGFISADLIKEFMFPPQDDLLIVVCGPPGMCKALKGALASVGYSDSMFYSYM